MCLGTAYTQWVEALVFKILCLFTKTEYYQKGKLNELINQQSGWC